MTSAYPGGPVRAARADFASIRFASASSLRMRA